MTTTSVEVKVKLAGREFKVKAPQGEEATLQEAARILNDKIFDIRAKAPQLTAEQMALLAALNLSHELLGLKMQQQSMQQSQQQAVAKLLSAVEGALTHAKAL